MITPRWSKERGHVKHHWLDTYHTFSFAEYYDVEQMGFGSLRVINEDWVAPGRGFPMHSHRDMEIITYVLDGAVQHRDSMGNSTAIRPGEVQRMSAGTGISHSEHNLSPSAALHLLQIWILSDREGITPSYEQTLFPDAEKRGRWRVVAAPDGRDGAVTIHQDAVVYATLLEPGETLTHALSPQRCAYLHVIRGTLSLNGIALTGGDGARIIAEPNMHISASSAVEALLFDMTASLN